MKSTTIKYLLTVTMVLGLFASSHAYAQTVFGGMAGYGTGAVNRGEAEAFSSYPVMGYLGYNWGKYNFHGYFENANLSYTHDGRAFNGIYGAYGVGGGLISPMGPKGKLTIFVQAPVMGSLILLTETKGLVNDFTYRQSTMVTLSGGIGYKALAGYEHIFFGRGKAGRSGSLYYGIFASYLNQGFARQVTRIKTNNSLLAPTSPGSEDVSHSMSIMSLLLSVRHDI